MRAGLPEPDNIVIFTVHKAASMLLYSLSKQLAASAGLPFFSPNEDTFPDTPQDAGGRDPFYKKTGVFAPVRYYFPFDSLSKPKVAIHLRDPRDILVSYFFSHTNSHPTGKNFNVTDNDRRRWNEMGIDQFVLSIADDLQLRFQAYRSILEQAEPGSIELLYYEKMVTDFPTWFAAFAKLFPIADQRKLVNSYADSMKSAFIVDNEDPKRHNRQISPGDHRRKLREETIDNLNQLLGKELNFFGFVM
jgi:hypothetical protein